MRKQKIKSGFYKKYEQDKKKRKENKQDKDNVIVIKEDKETAITTIFRGIGSVFRVIVYILLFILSSIGLTAIANEDIRIRLIEILNFMK